MSQWDIWGLYVIGGAEKLASQDDPDKPTDNKEPRAEGLSLILV